MTGVFMPMYESQALICAVAYMPNPAVAINAMPELKWAKNLGLARPDKFNIYRISYAIGSARVEFSDTPEVLASYTSSLILNYMSDMVIALPKNVSFCSFLGVSLQQQITIQRGIMV